MKTSCLFILLFASLLAGAQTTVTGEMKNPDGTAIVGSTSNYARFDLHYCGSNQPRVSGTTQIPVSQYKVKPDASGHVSVSLYGNDVITCGTTLGGTRWAVTYVVNNSPGPTCEYNITGGTFDLNTQICDNVAPVVTPPTGDTVYARLDGGNMPFTGGITDTQTGDYSSLALKSYVQALISGCNPQTEYDASGGAGLNALSAITGCASAPNTANSASTSGVSGYAVSNGATPPVGVTGQGRCTADNCSGFGGNFIYEDDGLRTTGILAHALEVDIGMQSPATAYSFVYGVNAVIQGNGAGDPSQGGAFVASTRSPGPHKWPSGFWSAAGSAQKAVISGPLCTSGTCNSQGIDFEAMNASSFITGTISGDSSGNIQLAPAAGKNVNVFGGFAVEEGSPIVAASGWDTIYGDSTAHCIKASYNNGTYSCIPNIGAAWTWASLQSFGAGISVTGGTTTDTLKVGASGSTISDTRNLVQGVYQTSGTANLATHMVYGSVQLSSGTPSTGTVTLAGAAVFTSSATYRCTLTNETTQANPVKITYTDGSHFTATGPNTVTDFVSFICVGN